MGNSKKPQEYSPIHGIPNSLECGGAGDGGSKMSLSSPESISKPSAVYDEKLQEWRL